ncbi:MAG: multicopper oxidase domain-containing protein [Actinomycetota bacterium]
MDAPQPPTPPQLVQVISLTRLSTALFSVLALLVSFGALAVASDNDGGGGGAAVQTGSVKAGSAVLEGSAIPATATEVAMKEFAFDPNTVMVDAGGVLKVANRGAAPHILAIDGTDLATPELQPNATAGLKVDSLKPGTYALSCTIPGHKAAGMTGELMVMDGGAAQHGGMPMMNQGRMDAAPMDALMAVRTKAFPAKTEGLGGQVLAPTVLPDGTKQWELTTKIVDWEIEPGKFVKAWTYNGVTPGPTLKADIGDKVRIVLHNELPESTVIHFHGLLTPNSMDGVPDITQEPVKPGHSFTYEFVAKGPAVGMYHSHHNAQVQVPNGLAGAFLVGQIPPPAGVKITQEIPMMLNDAGTIGLSLNGKSFPATAPVAVKPGESVLVHYLNEGVMSHPMHLHGQIQKVIAKDGIPLQFPYEADTINVAPGERYTVLVQAAEPGVWAWHCHILPHAEREDGMFGMVTAMIVK